MQAGQRVEFANTLRGFAALAVVISHYFGVFWLDRAAASTLTNAPHLPADIHGVPAYVAFLHASPVFNWGDFGVALFFVISGFVIPFSLRKATWQAFAASRFFRIMPTYVLGFSITLLAILLSTIYFERDWPFSHHEVLVHYVPGLRDLLWTRNIDGVVWTLEIEVKFYVICACLIVWFRRLDVKVFLAPLGLFAGGLLLDGLLPALHETHQLLWQLAMTFLSFAHYIIFMFVGVVFCYRHEGRVAAVHAWLGVAGLFGLFCLHGWALPDGLDLREACSYGFGLLAFAFAFVFPRLFRANPLFDFLAAISYPLYVVHAVTGYVALRIMLDMGLAHWLCLPIVTAASILLAWLVHRLVELPSQHYGRTLARRLAVPAAALPA